MHLSKNLTAGQFYADRKRCDWSARTPSLRMYLSFVCVYEHCNIVKIKQSKEQVSYHLLYYITLYITSCPRQTMLICRGARPCGD